MEREVGWEREKGHIWKRGNKIHRSKGGKHRGFSRDLFCYLERGVSVGNQ